MEIVRYSQETTQKPWVDEIGKGHLAISSLLSNRGYCALLPYLRSDITHDGIQFNTDRYDGLMASLQTVYQAFEPIAERLLRKKIRLARELSRQDIEDMTANQKMRMWETIMLRFSWEKYQPQEAQEATYAFLRYIKHQSRKAYTDEGRVISLQQETAIFDDIVDTGVDPQRALIAKEDERELAQVVTAWQERVGPKVAGTVRVFASSERLTLATIAKAEEIPQSTVRDRLATGRRTLIGLFKEHGYSGYKNLIESGSSKWGVADKDERLGKRRRLLGKLYPDRRRLLNPRIAAVLERYYGLNGYDPLYDYAKVAEATGIPAGSVRNYVSTGYRLVCGTLEPPARTARFAEGEKLYERFKYDKLADFTSEEYELMHLYFGQKLKRSEIAQRLEISIDMVDGRVKKLLFKMKKINTRP